MIQSNHNSRGDTIVEVLIALAVLTTILVGAYLTATRTQTSNRASQERSEAIKTAESQIERLKGLLVSGKVVAPVTGPFCVKSDNSGIQPVTTPANPFSESLASSTLPYQPTGCGDVNGRYNVAVQASGNTYEVLVRWNRAGGGKDQINMYYRTY